MTHEQHHNVSSLVSDLVTMAEATKRLPEVERELAEMREQARRDGDKIARLEIRLQQRSSELDELQTKLRSVEAERDDAGFRVLEAEDKANALRDAIETSFTYLGDALAAVSGDGRNVVGRLTSAEWHEWRDYQHAKTEAAIKAAEEAAKPVDPTVESSAQPSESSEVSTDGPSVNWAQREGSLMDQGQREPNPTLDVAKSTDATPSAVATPETALPSEPARHEGVSVQSDPTEVRHEWHPDGALLPAGSQSPNANTGDVAKADSAQESMPQREGRYSGKLYKSWPAYVSEPDWIAGGGTHESYWEGREGYRNASAR